MTANALQKNVKKQLFRIGQIAKENFGGEKSETLTAALYQSEKKLDTIRQHSHVISKKVHSCVQGSGSTVEKHQKKLPSNALATGLGEGGQALGQDSLLGTVMAMCGECVRELSSDEAHYERALETDVVGNLNALLEEEGPKVDKLKKKLHSARLDMDTAKSRHASAQRNVQTLPSKLEALQRELDEAANKFDHHQDAYATDMFRFLSREHEIAQQVYKLVERQLLWHRQSVKTLEECLPKLQAVLTTSPYKPLFCCPLEEHLKLCGCDVAVVIEQCVTALREEYMDTEGLFRIAGSAVKVKNLVAAFDARAEQMHLYDPHTIAGALKQYMRDLPEPLLTYKLYPEWTKAVAHTDNDSRLQALWQVAQQLPKANKHNLRYLMEFLNELSKYADVTKMTVSNLALVIGPNLIWPQADSSDAGTAGLVDTRRPAVITEALIEHVHWFFPDQQQESISPPASLPRSSPSTGPSLSPPSRTIIQAEGSPQPKPRRTVPVGPPSSSHSSNSPAVKSPPSDGSLHRRQPPPPPIKPKPTTS